MTDLGAIVAYQGNSTITTNCPTTWSTGNAPDSTSPNEVVFTAATPFDIPALSVPYCLLSFDIQVLALPAQGHIRQGQLSYAGPP